MRVYLPDKNKTYLLAVSGGVDSMALLHYFYSLSYRIRVAHCNFQLRGIEADLDAKLVKQWCKERDIECFTKHFHTSVYAAENKLSIQVAARRLRYSFFKDIMDKHAIDYLLTAHHRDDNVETAFFYFLRGTSIQGLCGIPRKNDSIIRPFLQVTKKEIECYAHENQVPFREDGSNRKEDYTRNKFRLSIIPELKKVFPTLEENIANNIERLTEVNQIYKQQIEIYRKKLIEVRGKDFYIPLLKLKNISPLNTVLYELLKPFGFKSEQTLEFVQLMQGHTGSYIQNDEYRVIKNRNFFIVTRRNAAESEQILISKEMNLVQKETWSIAMKSMDILDFKLHKEMTYCSLDASKLVWPLILRKWKQGDYMYPFGMQKKKKIAKILIDAKMPLHEKENVWVVESDKKIVWLVGMKADNRFRITPQTKDVLELKLK